MNIGILILILIFTIFIIISQIYRSKVFTTFFALGAGVFLLALLFIVNPTDNLEKTNAVIMIPGILLRNLMVIVIPMFIFTIIIKFIINRNASKIKGRTYVTSFLLLLLLPIIGIVIALLTIPLLLAIPDSWFIPNLSSAGYTNDGITLLSVFSSWQMLIIMIVLAIIVGLILKKMKKGNSFIDWLYKGITNYFKVILLLVPTVIVTMIPSLWFNQALSVEGNPLKILGVYLAIFYLGGLIIYFIFYSFILLNTTNEVTIKDKVKTLSNQYFYVFSTQSVQASLPYTQETSKELGICNEVSELTPTQGSIMGMTICNGFFPTLIIMFSIINSGGGVMDWPLLLTGIGVILVLVIIAAMSGSNDLVIIFTTLGLIGVSDAFFIAIGLPIQGVNEVLISKPTNTMGHLAVTTVVERVHERSHRK